MYELQLNGLVFICSVSSLLIVQEAPICVVFGTQNKSPVFYDNYVHLKGFCW